MFNSKDFISRRSDVISHFKNKGVSSSNISEYCSLAGIPIVVVCEFIIQEFPEHRKMCKEKIKQINEFFGVKEKTCGTCKNKCYQEHCIVND